MLARQKHVGRPPSMKDGQRVNVYLDADSLKTAGKLGKGNVSEGIRIALRAAILSATDSEGRSNG